MSEGNGNGTCVVQDLKVSDLMVDPRVNTRALNGSRVEAMAADFDAYGVGVLHVSIRDDGTLSLIDGNHRRHLLNRIGYGEQLVPCRIYTGLTVDQEARLFKRLNNTRKPSRIAQFMAGITGREPQVLALNGIIQSVGLTVSDSPGNGHILCIASLEALQKGDAKIAKKPDPRCILWTLECLRDAWGAESSSFKGALVHGLGLVFLRDAERVNRKDMVSKLATVPQGPTGLEARAKSAKEMHNRSLPYSAAGVITDLYNKGRGKGKLQGWWS